MDLLERGRAGETDHLPADPVPVAAIDRVGVEALARVGDQQRQEVEIDFGRGLLQRGLGRDGAGRASFRPAASACRRGGFEGAQDLVLLLRRQVDEVAPNTCRGRGRRGRACLRHSVPRMISMRCFQASARLPSERLEAGAVRLGEDVADAG